MCAGSVSPVSLAKPSLTNSSGQPGSRADTSATEVLASPGPSSRIIPPPALPVGNRLRRMGPDAHCLTKF